MATEQYLTHSAIHNHLSGDGTEDWKASSASTDVNSSGGFDCNICLDTVQDPVVTICGHLYCWPCIYKWIHQQSISSETHLDHNPQCPVCKAEISERTLVPLYGRGGQSVQSVTVSDHSDEKSADLGSVIPDRPRGPPCGVHTLITTSTTSDQYPTVQDAYDYTSAPEISLAGSMFGEMIYTRLFGNSHSFYTCPNSYGMATMRSARARRHTLHADQSLSRLSFFLCCCLVLCLLLF